MCFCRPPYGRRPQTEILITKSLVTYCRLWRYRPHKTPHPKRLYIYRRGKRERKKKRWDCHHGRPSPGHHHRWVGLIDGSLQLSDVRVVSSARALHLTDDRFDRSACWRIRLFGCVTLAGKTGGSIATPPRDKQTKRSREKKKAKKNKKRDPKRFIDKSINHWNKEIENIRRFSSKVRAKAGQPTL